MNNKEIVRIIDDIIEIPYLGMENKYTCHMIGDYIDCNELAEMAVKFLKEELQWDKAEEEGGYGSFLINYIDQVDYDDKGLDIPMYKPADRLRELRIQWLEFVKKEIQK